MTNEEKYKKVLETLNELFGDDSVPLEKAIENFETLAGEIEAYLDALRSDLKNKKGN